MAAYPKFRLALYVAAGVLAVLIFFLVLFNIVTKAQVYDAAPVIALVYGGIMGLAAKNTR